jgi:hypothetical protein
MQQEEGRAKEPRGGVNNLLFGWTKKNDCAKKINFVFVIYLSIWGKNVFSKMFN